MKLADFPVERPVATLVLLCGLMVLGAVSLTRLGLDYFPNIESPSLRVQIPFSGSHPIEGLHEVLEPLEGEIAAIPDIQYISGSAEPNEVSVWVEFGWQADLNVRRIEVLEAIERIRPQFPAGVGRAQVRTFQAGPGSGATLEARLSARRSLSESWSLLERRILRPLERIRGVGRVELGGVEPQEVLVELNPDALRQHRLAPRAVLTALQAANQDRDAGAIRGDNLSYPVRVEGRFQSVEEIAHLPIGTTGIMLSDVAGVARREPTLNYGRVLNDEFAISLEVYKEPNANTVETVDALLERIEEIKADPALQGINLLVWNNAGEEIKRALSGLLEAGVTGGLLAVIVLFLFMRRLSTTLIVAAAIPFSLLVTCAGMYLLESQFNVLTLLGLMLGVGMLVDNAVVVIENIYRLMSGGMHPRDAAKEGLRQVSMAVVASTATTVMVWSWLLMAERNAMTIMMGAVALTICLAVFCSWIVSVTFIPLASSRIPIRDLPTPGYFEERVIPAYKRLLALTMRHRVLSLVLLLGMAASAYYPIDRVEKSAEPNIRRRAVQLLYRAQDATDLADMATHVRTVEQWLASRKGALNFKDVYSYYNENGFGTSMIYPQPEDSDEAGLLALERGIRAGLPKIPGISLEVGEREWWRMDRGKRKRVMVALHGEDPEYLQEIASELETHLQVLPGVDDVRGPGQRGQLEALVEVDPERAALLGVSPRAVADTISFSFRGRQLRPFQTEEGELIMRIGLPEELQPGLDAIEDLLVDRADGSTIPVGSVARIQIRRSDLEIQREERAVTTYVGVFFDTQTRVEDGTARVEAALSQYRFPEGYTWDFGRWGQQREDGMGLMIRGVLLSLLIVTLLMAALFESLSQPLAILITLPLAFFGGFWALWLAGMELDVVAFVGVIVLIGVVVNNGIVLVDHVNQLRREGMTRDQALLDGCANRLRPVIMTAITTLVGLIPLSLSGFTVAGAYVNSLAVVVIGGLSTSTVFTLLALPVWVSTLEDAAKLLERSLPRRREAIAAKGVEVVER